MNRLALSLLLAFSASAPAAAATAPPFCDESLLDASDSPQAYRLRGDRCEGIYAQLVGALRLEVRGLVSRFAPYDPATLSDLVLAWTPPGGERPGAGPVRLRAFSLQPRTYFRMDTAVPAAAGSYHWPGDLVARLRLGPEDLGAVGWIELPGPGGRLREVYLPLRIGPGPGAQAAGGNLEATVVPSQRLRELRVTVHRLAPSGAVAATLRSDEEQGGYYPANAPTVFEVGRLGPPGFYRVEIAAVPAAGAIVRTDFELYHAGD